MPCVFRAVFGAPAQKGCALVPPPFCLTLHFPPRQTHTQTHTDTQTHREKERHTHTQTHRHTDTQTHREKERHTHRHTHTHIHASTCRLRWPLRCARATARSFALSLRRCRCRVRTCTRRAFRCTASLPSSSALSGDTPQKTSSRWCFSACVCVRVCVCVRACVCAKRMQLHKTHRSSKSHLVVSRGARTHFAVNRTHGAITVQRREFEMCSVPLTGPITIVQRTQSSIHTCLQANPAQNGSRDEGEQRRGRQSHRRTDAQTHRHTDTDTDTQTDTDTELWLT